MMLQLKATNSRKATILLAIDQEMKKQVLSKMQHLLSLNDG